jgi:hypothetical protein
MLTAYYQEMKLQRLQKLRKEPKSTLLFPCSENVTRVLLENCTYLHWNNVIRYLCLFEALAGTSLFGLKY